MRDKETPNGVIVCGVVLLIGSAMGVIGALIGLVSTIDPSLSISALSLRFGVTISDIGRYVLCILGLGVFGFCFRLGLQVWNGDPTALRLARYVFLAQVIMVRSVVTYNFQVLGFTPYVTSTGWIGATFGAYLDVMAYPTMSGAAFGLNFIAIAATIYLFRATSPPRREVKPGDNFGLA